MPNLLGKTAQIAPNAQYIRQECEHCGVMRTEANDKEQCLSIGSTWMDLWPTHVWTGNK